MNGIEAVALSSPFASARPMADAQLDHPPDAGELWLSGPFAVGTAAVAEVDQEANTLRQLLAELHDENFHAALN
jgi:hypothetical protein